MKIKKVIIVNLVALAVTLTPTASAENISSSTPSKTKPEVAPLLLQDPLASDTYRLTSGFAVQIDPETERSTGHNGIDYAAPEGTAIVAANDGVVIFAGNLNGYEETIMIKHNSEITTLYGHILPGSFLVKAGDTVKKGQKIAAVGSSESTESNLHFSIFKEGKAINPSDYLNKTTK